MARVVVVVALLAACSGKKEPAASGSGSASGAVAAPIADAATPADAARPGRLQYNCSVEPPGLKCVMLAQLGPLPAKCWHVLVAIEDHVAAKVRIVTTKQACAPEIKAGEKFELALEIAAKDALGKACEADDACDFDPVAPEGLAAATAAWRKQILDGLVADKAQREAEARDAQLDHTYDINKLLLHYAQITADTSHDQTHADAFRSVMSAGTLVFNGLCECPEGFTKGQVRCAFEAGSPESFRDCFKSNLPIDAGVPASDAGDDAGVPAIDAGDDAGVPAD